MSYAIHFPLQKIFLRIVILMSWGISLVQVLCKLNLQAPRIWNVYGNNAVTWYHGYREALLGKKSNTGKFDLYKIGIPLIENSRWVLPKKIQKSVIQINSMPLKFVQFLHHQKRIFQKYHSLCSRFSFSLRAYKVKLGQNFRKIGMPN